MAEFDRLDWAQFGYPGTKPNQLSVDSVVSSYRWLWLLVKKYDKKLGNASVHSEMQHVLSGNFNEADVRTLCGAWRTKEKFLDMTESDLCEALKDWPRYSPAVLGVLAEEQAEEKRREAERAALFGPKPVTGLSLRLGGVKGKTAKPSAPSASLQRAKYFAKSADIAKHLGITEPRLSNLKCKYPLFRDNIHKDPEKAGYRVFKFHLDKMAQWLKQHKRTKKPAR